jgi:hypothetical protein
MEARQLSILTYAPFGANYARRDALFSTSSRATAAGQPFGRDFA